jgi:hypothetical protein
MHGEHKEAGLGQLVGLFPSSHGFPFSFFLFLNQPVDQDHGNNHADPGDDIAKATRDQAKQHGELLHGLGYKKTS